jgi:hypothetical protein
VMGMGGPLMLFEKRCLQPHYRSHHPPHQGGDEAEDGEQDHQGRDGRQRPFHHHQDHRDKGQLQVNDDDLAGFFRLIHETSFYGFRDIGTNGKLVQAEHLAPVSRRNWQRSRQG